MIPPVARRLVYLPRALLKSLWPNSPKKHIKGESTDPAPDFPLRKVPSFRMFRCRDRVKMRVELPGETNRVPNFAIAA